MDRAKEIIKSDLVIQKILPILSKYKSYLVGGYIRDAFLNKMNPDRDFIIETEDISKVAKEIADFTDGHYIVLDEENNIYRIVLKDKINYIDVTKPINNKLSDDLERRDLTLNSIAYDFSNDEFIDLFNGIEDINNKIIKEINEQNFIDDPLRILRIYRFKSTLGFKISNNLEIIAKSHRNKIKSVAKERIQNELMKLFLWQWNGWGLN